MTVHHVATQCTMLQRSPPCSLRNNPPQQAGVACTCTSHTHRSCCSRPCCRCVRACARACRARTHTREEMRDLTDWQMGCGRESVSHMMWSHFSFRSAVVSATAPFCTRMHELSRYLCTSSSISFAQLTVICNTSRSGQHANRQQAASDAAAWTRSRAACVRARCVRACVPHWAWRRCSSLTEQTNIGAQSGRALRTNRPRTQSDRIG